MLLLEASSAYTAAFRSRLERVARPSFRRDCLCAAANGNGSVPSSLRHSPGQRHRVSSKVAATRLLLEDRTATAEAPVREEMSDETLREALSRRVSSLGAEEAARRARSAQGQASERSDAEEAAGGTKQLLPPATVRRRRQLAGRRGTVQGIRRSTRRTAAGGARSASAPRTRARAGGSALVSSGSSSSPEAAARFEASTHAGPSAAANGHMSKEEELDVITAIQSAHSLEVLSSAAASSELRAVLQRGEAAKRRLMDLHRGMLVKMANQFLNQGVTREELLLEGEGALLHAALAFNAGKGARLTTYAWFHIMRALTELVQREGALLPMSTAAVKTLRRLDDVEGQLTQQLGRTPTLAEVAAQAGVTPKRAALLRSRKAGVRAWEAMGGFENAKGGDARGADELIGGADVVDGGQTEELEFYRDEAGRSLANVVNVALDMLPAKQATVLKQRYGLVDGRARTLREIGASLDPPMSAESVRSLAEEGRRAMEAFVAEYNLFRDLL